jgi:hypothetical protein
MSTLREAAQQALEALGKMYTPRQPKAEDFDLVLAAITALRAALAQQEATGKESLQVEQREPTVKESLMVPKHIAEQMTTTDLAWLETRRLVRVWKELGQMRWVGADEGWGRAIEAVCARLDKECQDVLAWKEKVDASGETAVQLLRKMQGGQE